MDALSLAGAEPSFADLGVPAPLVDALAAAGIHQPFAIQTEAVGPALDGRDVLGRAPTGSGKTLAFGIPLVARLGVGEKRRPAGLVLAPTRELADQIARALEPLCAAVDRSVVTVYGGVGFGPQTRALRAGVDLVVACPGRLEDLIAQGEVELSNVSFVVVDEADRMADMGFLPVVRRILDLTASERQTVLFSATLDNEVGVVTERYQDDPVTCEVGEVEPDLSTMTHRFIRTEKEHKIRLAADVIDASGPTVMFCRTRHGVDRVARQLKRLGVKAGWIHGGRTQRQRDAALDAFTDERVQVLVATDVAARGIHVDGVACVIHYDPPADAKDYVHRSGRTARAGATGVVVSFVNSDQVKQTNRLQKQIGIGPFPLEPTPELTEREPLPWVDQRKGTKKQTNNAKRKKQGGTAKRENTAKRDNTAKRENTAKRDSTTKRDDGARDWEHRERRAEPGERGEGSGRSDGGRSKGRAGAKRSGATGGASRNDGGKRTSKRSGKPRPKNKQRRAKQTGGGATAAKRSSRSRRPQG